MNARNARIIDDLLAETDGERLYRWVRDGKTCDLVEVLQGLEQRMDSSAGHEALVRFTSLLLDCRPERGAQETRDRDRLAKKLIGERSPPRSCKARRD